MDGLFNIGASFSAGFGTQIGRGYVIDLHMSTLTKVDKDIKNRIEVDAIKLIKSLLPKYFPERKLEVSRDGSVYKIHGDLSLGSL